MLAVYARQSVDRADSISIESQIEFCMYETRGEAFQTYIDRGYSGKNTNRPQFQEMLEAIRNGAISKVIVYKLDRISRSILDFANMMEAFQKSGVEFISSTEKFDTSTPMGRAMLNICIVFAQLERETIQKRVADAYLCRSRKGLFMGGRIPYGYRREDTMIDGVKTSMYVEVPEEAEQVRLIYEMYVNPQTSFGDIVARFAEMNIENCRIKAWDRTRMGQIIRNPLYVKADLAVYEFFKQNGTNIFNDACDFIGSNGCYLYTGEDAILPKAQALEGQNLVIGPHQGLIESDVWLKCRKKCMNNRQVAKPLKAKNSWLAGKVKCGRCGYALRIAKAKTRKGRYFVCSRKMQAKACEGTGTIYADDFEAFILNEMCETLKDFSVLKKKSKSMVNPRVQELAAKARQLDVEIEALLGKVASSNEVLLRYINDRVSDLDAQKQAALRESQELQREKPLTDMSAITGYMEHWDKLTFDDKRLVTDTLIEMISALDDHVEIRWRI